MEIKQLYFKG